MSPCLFVAVICLIATARSMITCDTAYQCVGETYDNTTNAPYQVNIRGYKSGVGSTFASVGRDVFCRSARACVQSTFTENIRTQETSCGGVLSCANSTITTSNIYLRGTNAASFVSFTANPQYNNSTMRCRALQSCSHALIHYMPIITARGAYALYKANINTQNSDGMETFTVDLLGDYAAFGAKMICDTGTSCTINCYAYTSCSNFYVDCRGQCTINTLFNGKNTIAPITDIIQFDPVAAIPSVWDSLSFTDTNDASCTASAYAADDHLEFVNANLTISDPGPICCRSRKGCRLTHIQYKVITGKYVICSAHLACDSAHIDSNYGKVFCNGRSSCKLATIINTETLYCGGQTACAPSIVSGTSNIICAANRACDGITITSGGIDINVQFAADEQSGVNIYCNVGDVCSINCGSYLSCNNVTLHCDGTCEVQCDTWSGCPVGYTLNPTQTPTKEPTPSPSFDPTETPTKYPTEAPTKTPTKAPTINPTKAPTDIPTKAPTDDPTNVPTISPSNVPTSSPTDNPTSPSSIPTLSPTDPTLGPTDSPSTPTFLPSVSPTNQPTLGPTHTPSQPTAVPSSDPSKSPSGTPTKGPTATTTLSPTLSPTDQPTAITSAPSYVPTISPSAPTSQPSISPTNQPSLVPTNSPSHPTFVPSMHPTKSPTRTPTDMTSAPSYMPTFSPSAPTSQPSISPTKQPSISPTISPSHPTSLPSMHPSNSPSITPTKGPTTTITLDPTLSPTDQPTATTSAPSYVPTISPSAPTSQPSISPTKQPSITPTSSPSHPTSLPSMHPSHSPSRTPTKSPTSALTLDPTLTPTNQPTYATLDPSSIPTQSPTNTTMNPTNAPSLFPTNNPSYAPSITPSLAPSIMPSLYPTTSPSAIPTSVSLLPTLASFSPTWMPSLEPTAFPSLPPTQIPSRASLNPSIIPSVNPSNMPSFHPTNMPVMRPTIATLTPSTSTPSTAPTISFSAAAVWSSTFLTVFIDIDIIGIILDASSLMNNCSAIFDTGTLKQIGGNKAVCTWIHTENIANSQDITIILPSTATLNLTHNKISIKPGAFSFQMSTDGALYTLSAFIDILLIEPQVISTPNIITNIQSVIGRCDDLILDARSTTNLGGRNNAYFEWFIYGLNTTKEGSFVIVPNAEITELMNDITVKLTVTNWYDATSSLVVHIYKSVLEFVPQIELSGISEFSQASDKLLNGQIAIHSSIIFGNDCDDQLIELESDEFSTRWFVEIAKQNENDVIDEDILRALNTYLLLHAGQTSIVIDTTYHIQSGIMYIFTMNFKCDGNIYNCDVNATHVITYKYSDIVCKIMGGNIVFDGIHFEDLLSYQMLLNGGLFTYDPDELSSSDHLLFDWKCMDRDNKTCVDLLDSTNSATINVDFGMLSASSDSIQPQDEYLYTFSLNVYDAYNAQRDHCTHSVQFSAIILKEENVTNSTDLSPFAYLISTTAISNSIHVYDKVRIVANIINNNNNEYIEPTSHIWHEENGLLTDSDIVQYSESADNSLNLILQSSVLTAGTTYSFELEVFNHDNTLKAYGKSGANSIYVLTGARIIDNTFKLSPECSDGIITYDSIDDYMQEKHSFSVATDGDYPPLLYQFIYNDNHYLHPNLISTPYLNDIYLPIGATNNIFSVHVYDAASALVTDTLQCDIVFASYSQCVDLDIFDTESFVTDHEKQLNILQIAYVYLQYMYTYDGDNSDECVTETLSTILTQVNDNIQDLCESNMVILLSQVLKLWMDFVAADDDLVDFYYKEKQYISHIEELLFKALDPCFYIRTVVGFDHVQNELSVSTDSIVTNIVKIYHKNSEITSYLSLIETHDKYKHLLYTMTESMIVFIKTSTNQEIYKLLSSTLYIASLSTVSTSIPGEEIVFEFDDFFVFTTRISNDNNLSVTVQNISIYIPDDFLSANDDNDNQNPFGDASDIVIVGMERNASSVNISLTGKNKNKCSQDATLSEQSISITINGGNSTTSNASFIQFSFPCSGSKCDNDFECMWHNPVTDIWLNEGCDTEIDKSANKIICTCVHLTTFATIHNINKKCSRMMSDWFDSQYFDALHLLFAALYGLLAIYIMLEIYPFFIDKYLTIKQRSIVVMLLILLVSILYLLICITFYMLKVYQVNENRVSFTNIIITVSLLVVQFVYLIIYSLIFYTWFSISHAWRPNQKIWNTNMRVTLYAFNAVIATFLVIACLYVVVFSSSANMEYFQYFEIIWSVISLILSTVLVIYSFCTTKVLLRSAQVSKTQNWGHKEAKLAKKLVFINALIALFFIFSTVSTIYFTLNLNAFNLMYRGIDLFLNWIFIVLLCWMYRDAMKRIVLTDASKVYHFDKYYCFCSKHFVLTNRIIQLSRMGSESQTTREHLSRMASESQTTRGRRGTNTNTTRYQSEDRVDSRVDSNTKLSELPSHTVMKNEKSMTSKTLVKYAYQNKALSVGSMSSSSEPIISSPSASGDTAGDALKATDFALTTDDGMDTTAGEETERPVSPRDKLLGYAQMMGSVTVGGFETIEWDKNNTNDETPGDDNGSDNDSS